MHQNSPTAISDFKIFPGEKPRTPAFRGPLRAISLRQSGTKVKYVTTRPPMQSSQFDVSFPKKLLKFVATRGKIF